MQEAIAALLACLLTIAQHPRTLKISGHVVAHLSRRPLRNVEVAIAPPEHPDRRIATFTDDDGAFQFADVPAGKHTLQVTERGWIRLYQQLDEYSTAIVTGLGRDSENIVVSFPEQARITGTVRDTDGDPVQGAKVLLFQKHLVRGIQQTGQTAGTTTNSDGHFHFTQLSAGTYYIAVNGRPWYAQYQFVTVPGRQNNNSEIDVTYPLTYYQAGERPESATPITLAEGNRVELNMTLHAVPALHLSFDGIEKAPDQQMQAWLTQSGPGGFPIGLSGVMMNSEMGGIAPGEYVLKLNLVGKQQQELESMPISIHADSTIHLSDLINGGASLKGKVAMEGNTPQSLEIWLKNLQSGADTSALVKADGSFEINQIAAGRYSILLANAPDHYMSQVVSSNSSYQDGELDIPAGAHAAMTINVATGVGSFVGVALQNSKPVGGAMVLLLPMDKSHGAYIPRDQSDSDGTFSLNSVIPGRYTLVAIEDGAGLAYGEKGVMDPYLKKGVTVEVPVKKDFKISVEVQAR